MIGSEWDERENEKTRSGERRGQEEAKGKGKNLVGKVRGRFL